MIVSWWLMGGKGMVSSGGQGEGLRGSGSWGVLGGFRVGYEEGDGIPGKEPGERVWKCGRALQAIALKLLGSCVVNF